jgi:hypothetical protein
MMTLPDSTSSPEPNTSCSLMAEEDPEARIPSR